MKRVIQLHKASRIGAAVMPQWFAPVLAITTVVMILSAIRVARDKKVISP